MRELSLRLLMRGLCGVCVCAWGCACACGGLCVRGCLRGWCEYEIVLIFFDASNAMLI